MGEVIAMGYIGLGAPDVDAWRQYATEILGMAVAEGSTPETLYLRMDERAWRFQIAEGPAEFSFLGLKVVNQNDLEAIAQKLELAGYRTQENAELAKSRGVNGLVSVQDPDGNRLEIFHGARQSRDPFVSPTGAQFVAGRLGFGHVVIVFEHFEDSKHFYMDLLGFRLSDTIGETQFTHVNGRHHSIGIARANAQRPAGLNHFMVQVSELDVIGRALDRVLDGAAPLQQTLGKHTNDHMVSFYTFAPSGLRVEYGWGGRIVDDEEWTTSSYDSANVWGHKRLMEVLAIPEPSLR